MMRKKYQGNSRFWNANIYFAEEIAACANYLLKHFHGYPGILDKPNPHAKKFKYSIANEKKWRGILAEIRDGFKLYVKCDGDFHDWKNGKRPTHRHEKQPDGSVRWIQTNDAELFLSKKKEKRFKRAMALFAKYFDHLWD